jgi:ATP-dependent DNA helicase RecG
VLKWLRPAPKQFNIYWGKQHRNYEPDFIAEIAERIYMCEVKAFNEIPTPEFQEKGRAGAEYCRTVSEWNAKHTDDPFFLIDSRNISVRDNIAKEIVSNILVHRDFSGTFPARVVIEKDRLVAENWNRALRHGHIDLSNFEPYPKNPILARFFVQIGYADTLGSGVRNLVKFTKLYSGGEPELIEGNIFRTIIPLAASEKQANNKRIKQANKTSEKKQATLVYIKEHGQATVSDLVELFGLSEGRVRAILLEMTKENLIEKVGKTKSAYYVLKA